MDRSGYNRGGDGGGRGQGRGRGRDDGRGGGDQQYGRGSGGGGGRRGGYQTEGSGRGYGGDGRGRGRGPPQGSTSASPAAPAPAQPAWENPADQTLANIGLKINAKLGGSNMELNEPLCRGSEHVMFVGADVNHPSPMNKECPSIAAVVATMNFPAANRYAARVTPQTHRKERILTFGSMVLDLVNNYEKVNKVKPKKIVIFRDGVSDGQFDMVLNEELPDIKQAVFNNNYRPTITLVVAQKRHQTRLFPENEREGGPTGNVPPGTVVDTIIIHPSEFDFYLCSHFGGIGTSKPTHYYVLYDEHRFMSDQLQKLIYNMCYTFARCTKPVSLVPPVYYADLVAYRGRLYQEAIMSMGSPAPSVASGSSSISFDDKFYQLHPELQNVMYFV